MNEIGRHDNPGNNVINTQFKIKMVVNYQTQVLHFINQHNSIATNT